jgi:flagellar biosynthesis GTPase FlhF
LNRIQSSRRLERETQRNVELIWLSGRLSPDFKTIADFRKDNGPAIRRVYREFVLLCRSLNLFSDALVAIDGSKFKAVNGRDRNFTKHKLRARMQQLEESIARYLADLDRADRDTSSVTEARVEHLKEKVETVKAQMRRLKHAASALVAGEPLRVSGFADAQNEQRRHSDDTHAPNRELRRSLQRMVRRHLELHQVISNVFTPAS